jgi:hypothetical protein
MYKLILFFLYVQAYLFFLFLIFSLILFPPYSLTSSHYSYPQHARTHTSVPKLWSDRVEGGKKYTQRLRLRLFLSSSPARFSDLRRLSPATPPLPRLLSRRPGLAPHCYVHTTPSPCPASPARSIPAPASPRPSPAQRRRRPPHPLSRRPRSSPPLDLPAVMRPGGNDR